jgi:hypothetical protein
VNIGKCGRVVLESKDKEKMEFLGMRQHFE